MTRAVKENVDKVKKMRYEQNGNTDKQVESPKRDKQEILHQESTIAEMVTLSEGFKDRFEQREEKNQ